MVSSSVWGPPLLDQVTETLLKMSSTGMGGAQHRSGDRRENLIEHLVHETMLFGLNFTVDVFFEGRGEGFRESLMANNSDQKSHITLRRKERSL